MKRAPGLATVPLDGLELVSGGFDGFQISTTGIALEQAKRSFGGGSPQPTALPPRRKRLGEVPFWQLFGN